MRLSPLLLATTNPDKLQRLRWLVQELPIEAVALSQLSVNPIDIPEEHGASHKAIACSKAMAWSRLTALAVIASDGGLRIPALGSSWSSLTTGRFAGEGASNREKTRSLLNLMAPFKGEERRATWVEAVALACKGRCLASWEVTGADGVLLDEPPSDVPDPGFWVFPLWYIPKFGRTYDRLEDAELASLGDHWGQLKSQLHDFFETRQDVKP